MEMELKLLVDPEARHLIEQHPAFSAVKPRKRKAVSTYYDTPDRALFRMGATLRVRRSGQDFVQTVKLDSPGHDLGARGEWEWPLPSAALDTTALTSLPEDAAMVRDIAERVKPVFVTDVVRTSWPLHFDDGTAIEAVIDRGTIRAGSRSLDISEVELELKQGSTAHLYRLAIDLAERAHLRFGPLSKSARGYGLIDDPPPDRPAAPLPAWDKAISIGAVFPRLVHAALRELAGEIPAASEGAVEGVHRMRAAIRKLRSILVLFGPCIERRAARRFNEALRALGGILGQGRDWDVFLTETLTRAEATERGGDAMLLRVPAEHKRVEAHAAIAEAMRAHPLTGLILGIGAWTQNHQWLRKAKAGTPLAELVPDLLHDLDRKARKRAELLDADVVEELHGLRKSLKKLRYSVEYVGFLFDPEEVTRYLHAIKDVLGTLGDINDAAVTEHRIADIASADKPDLAPAAAALLQETARRRAKAIGKLPKKLRKLHGIKPFWA